MKIILCGLPGSGKTTVGQILAQKIKGAFIDVDHLIEDEYAARTGQVLNCRQIFQQKGADFFRKFESLIIASLASKPLKDAVISLGGGAFEVPENIQLLKSVGTLVYLKLDLEELFRRINRNGLPAYLDPKDPFKSFETLAKKRTIVFENAAEIELDTSKLSAEAIADKILKNLAQKIDMGYPVLIKEGLDLFRRIKDIRASQYVILTNTEIESRYGKELQKLLQDQGLNVSLFAFPPGESYKTRATKESCENHMLQLGAGRDTCVIGLGGGVVTDIAGFTASTYCRGVPVVLIPTSLLAMVDAAIGGKTGVDVPEGKNLIGTIYQPRAVMIDPSFLKTLPSDELKNGFSEMIKHGLIADKNYFLFMKSHAKELLALDATLMEKAIYDSVVIKAAIVMEDETEQGKRRLLNLGHTIAHAIETATNHQIAHGKAVAIGTIAESYLSMKMGHLPEYDFQSIREIFTLYQMNLTWDGKISPDKLMEIMKMDKKALGKIPRFVLLEGIGKPLEFNGQYCTIVDENLLKTTIEWMCSDVMHCH